MAVVPVPGTAALGISLATVERDWRTVRIWLRREMKKGATL